MNEYAITYYHSPALVPWFFVVVTKCFCAMTLHKARKALHFGWPKP